MSYLVKEKTRQTYSYDNLYQLIKVEGETTYNPYRSSVPEFVSNYSQDFVFDIDGLGNMTSKVSKESVRPNKKIGDNLNYNFTYVYDENFAHRLVRAGDRYYKYDANGNIICEQDGSFESNGNDTAYHKIEQETEDVYSTDYGWGLFKEDKTGSTTSRYRRTYTWNERNQLVSSVDANYSTAYVYGQDGQRSNKYTGNSETLYFNKMWTHHTDSGNSIYGGQTSKNIYLGETRIVTKLNSGEDPTYQEEYYKQYYYHSDHLGSASLISDYQGDEYQRIEYTPYGETWVEKTQNTGLEYLPYKFTAKELDEETGLYYYGARYLDPRYSMWISTDPALGDYVSQSSKGEGGIYNSVNLNLYHYANNNPVKYIDPTGKFSVVPMLIGGVISAAVDYGFQVAGNILEGKKGTEIFTEVNVGQIAGSFVSGALTTVGIGFVSKAASMLNSGAKFVQVVGSSGVSSIASVPGTVVQNTVNNIIDPKNKVGVLNGALDNMKSSAKAGAAAAIITPVAKIPSNAPDYILNKPNYSIKGNVSTRKGALPGTAQASVTQVFKDFGSEIIGQGVNQLFDGINNMYQQKKYTEERINYYESLYGNKE